MEYLISIFCGFYGLGGGDYPPFFKEEEGVNPYFGE
jgi:hypothetical protein